MTATFRNLDIKKIREEAEEELRNLYDSRLPTEGPETVLALCDNVEWLSENLKISEEAIR